MRIYTSESNPLDFCRRCMPSLETAKKRYSNKGDAPDNRGNCFEFNSNDHPSYDGWHECETCGRELTLSDEYSSANVKRFGDTHRLEMRILRP